MTGSGMQRRDAGDGRLAAWLAASLLLHALALPLVAGGTGPGGTVSVPKQMLEVRLAPPGPRPSQAAPQPERVQAPTPAAEPASVVAAAAPQVPMAPARSIRSARPSRAPGVAQAQPEMGQSMPGTAAGGSASLTQEAAAGPALRPDPMPQLLALLHDAIERHKHYPMAARRLQREGITRIGFRLAPDGRIGGVEVVASSGHPGLDEAALAAVTDASPVADAARYLGGPLALQIEVTFRLD